MKYCHCMWMLVNMSIRLWLCAPAHPVFLLQCTNSQCLCCTQRSHVPLPISSVVEREIPNASHITKGFIKAFSHEQPAPCSARKEDSRGLPAVMKLLSVSTKPNLSQFSSKWCSVTDQEALASSSCQSDWQAACSYPSICLPDFPLLFRGCPLIFRYWSGVSSLPPWHPLIDSLTRCSADRHICKPRRDTSHPVNEYGNLLSVCPSDIILPLSLNTEGTAWTTDGVTEKNLRLI